MKILAITTLTLLVFGFTLLINHLQEEIEKSCNNSGGSYLSGRCIHIINEK